MSSTCTCFPAAGNPLLTSLLKSRPGDQFCFAPERWEYLRPLLPPSPSSCRWPEMTPCLWLKRPARMPGRLEWKDTVYAKSMQKKKKKTPFGQVSGKQKCCVYCSGNLTTIVGLGDGIKLLLPSCVPQH